ncbi:EF-hand calcium-binding domain-containing protein 6-like [Saccoglossus kowalevskii]|uniref:EF-hand calcium-binding domain-containing protein 6-like n=1 Tax=Saccoglossus kowalevskii TaxID=10224 RepID=A0ABM0GQ72_SACKO|nr:PREDICTED: EF-hand calcium-binding domain-containing protein 6-like [Saccoglossus kowalevskii]
MSQVGVQSRPATQMSQVKIGNLPEIQHPLSRLGNPEKLNIRGLSSRAGERPSSNPAPRPASELPFHVTPRMSRSATGREVLHESLDLKKVLPRIPGPFSPTIPEGVEYNVGDPDKTKLPVFGARADLQSRAESRTGVVSRASSRPDTRFRLEVDELEILLREKAKRGYYELRKLFVSNDPEGKGTVSRDALHRIITIFVGQFVGPKQFNHLMARLRLAEKLVVRLDEFYACFREQVNTEMPRWMDPVNRHHVEKVSMTATQVHVQLKEKAKQRFIDVADLFPQMNPGGSGRILKPEFRNVLNRMLFFMEEEEFEKLWAKYDTEGIGVINGEKMLNKLGITLRSGTASPTKQRLDSADSTSSRTPKKLEAERSKSLDVELWLKNKFREGFANMRSEFKKYDKEKTGKVNSSDFRKVVDKFGLKLDNKQVEDFCARCGIDIKDDMISYKDFLQRFQDRSESGMPHTILSNPKHKFNKSERSASPSAASSLTAAEAKLMGMFQRDFLSLLGTFHKIDKQHTDRITQEEFRAAIESRFGIEINDSEFADLIDRVPLDDEGRVKYPAFMSQFDTTGTAPSLFDAKSTVTTKKADIMKIDHDNGVDELMDYEEYKKGRSVKELTRIVRRLLKKNYQEVEAKFNDMDDINSRRLTRESLHELLKSFDLKPEVTHGEIRKLWDTLITNANGTLDFLQFVRHFGYSLRSAAFPNAKLVPPRRGDADFLLRSRKLNCAGDMLEDNLRAKIDYMWDDLRKEFLDLDQYGTGFVSKTEFKDILQELCVHLNEYELEMLCRKFDTKNDGRICFVEFLRPFALRRTTHRVGNNMAGVMSHPQAEVPLASIVDDPQKGLSGLTARLRQKLVGDWRNLRRAFKKIDSDRSGFLTVPEFRSVLTLCNIIMNEEEVYHVMSTFDENMDGRINYNKFISETFKSDMPEARFASI